MTSTSVPKCRRLVLDAGPLLSLSPLRGLAETYLTVPQVLAELKDNRAREHFQQLGLMSGVNVEIRSPDSASLFHVIQWAKKTGDYSVLSHPDLCVLALTYTLDQEDNKSKGKQQQEAGGQTTISEAEQGFQEHHVPSKEQSAIVTVEDLTDKLDEIFLEDLQADHDSQRISEENIAAGFKDISETTERGNVELKPIIEKVAASAPSPTPTPSTGRGSPVPLYDDPSDEDDGEGEWITPANSGIHKSRAMDLLPDEGFHGNSKKVVSIGSGCMTADFAMQNVLLQMGLNLVGLEGKRIEKIKSWVLRCHACFKICKDNSKKFCPSCGNPTLLRASVTVAAPGASPHAQAMQVHLKSNFQYKIRGTKYSIPAPKPGSSKTGPGTGLILREDQLEYMRAKKRSDGKREREEDRILKGILSRGVESKGNNAGVGSWMDPDWVPEIISVGSGGKGRTVRSSRMDGDMPQIGHGRKNPNEKRRKK